MSKEYLEALERLAMPDDIHIKECEKLGIGLTEDYDLLEQYILKAQEPKQYVDELKLVEKKLKALEIIKEKRVACDLLTNPDVMDYKKYNSHCDKYDFIVPLTEEEFNLLKEVLE